MSQSSHKPTLDAYLDGVLAAPDRERVERALRGNAPARDQVALQGRIDASLRRLFDPPATVALPAVSRSHGTRLRVFWPLAAAAALLIVAAGVWVFVLRGAAGPSPLGPLYRAQLAAGFIPEKVCTTSEQFAEWVHTYYGQSLYPPEKHDGVEFVGWNYAKAVGQHSGVLLARVRGKEVVVVCDRALLDKKPFKNAGDPGLHSFRAQMGSVVLYEVTPYNEPAILPILSTTPPTRH